MFMLMVGVYSLSACSSEQWGEACETKSNLPLEVEEETTPYHTKHPLSKDFLLFDGDGDGVKNHIVEHSLVDIFGGHGSYDLYVYAKSITGQYHEIFSSNEYLLIHKNMDLEITSIRDGKILFRHHETGYEMEYVVDENSYPYLFNVDGTSKGTPNFVVDSSKSVEAIDIDHDGSEELVMRQYVSIGWNANYIGDCITVWKIMKDELILVSVTISIN